MKKRYELWATVSEWQDKGTGQKHKRQIMVGTVFESPTGSMSMLLEALPIVPGWKGWVSFRDVKETATSQPNNEP